MNISESSKLIQTYLDLDRAPVGIKFIYDKESYDKLDLEERENKITYCNSVNLASKGKSMKIRKEHQACPNGAVALGFVPAPPKMANGEVRLSKNIYKDLETSKSVSDGMDFNTKEPYGIAVMSLDNCPVEPDVVICVSGSYNIMRLIQGYSYNKGYSPNIKTVGLQAVCHDLTTYPMNHDDINITFLCPGTRLVADWQMHELGIGISFSNWYDVVEGVIQTTNPFVRDRAKKEIIERAKKNNIDVSEINLNLNYDTGSYKGGKIN